MLRTPAELRAEARIYTAAVRREPDPEMKRRLARHAFTLAQLAEHLEREGFVISSNIDRYEHMLDGVLDDSRRKQVDILLNEERAKRAALAAKGRHGHVAARADRLLDEAIAAIGADMGNVQAVDCVTGCLRIVASRGFDAPFLDFFAVVPDGDHAACGAALKRRDRIIVPDIEASPIFAAQRSRDVLRDAGVRAVQSTPILDRAGTPVGMISTHWRSVCVPGEAAMRRLDGVIESTMSGIEAA